MSYFTQIQADAMFESYWKYSQDTFECLLGNLPLEHALDAKAVAKICFAAGIMTGSNSGSEYHPFWLDGNETVDQLVNASYLPDGP